jgi:hypothetical protein
METSDLKPVRPRPYLFHLLGGGHPGFASNGKRQASRLHGFALGAKSIGCLDFTVVQLLEVPVSHHQNSKE